MGEVPMPSYIDVPFSKIVTFCRQLFPAYGFSANESKLICDVLLSADLYGIESHGIHRLIRYDEEITSGAVDVHAKTEVVFETPLSAVIDAKGAMGQLVSVEAMNLAISKASKSGAGFVSVRNSNHYGIAGFYTDMAVENDMIGICMTNSEAICVPTNGKKAMLGTNPIAFSMPAVPYNFSFDASTTVVPRGKLEVFTKNGQPLPGGWAIDDNGRMTVDGLAVIDRIIRKAPGGIAPLGGVGEGGGGHKGYGLALMVDICCGILSGGLTSNYINLKPGEINMSHFFAAIDYGLFGDKAEIKKHLNSFLQELRSSPTAAGCTRIYTAGEKRSELKAARKNGTIPVNEKTISELQTLAKKLGVKKLEI
jgi:LDH2 family malate/lactate/ureidoglycolate dehydrogenase